MTLKNNLHNKNSLLYRSFNYTIKFLLILIGFVIGVNLGKFLGEVLFKFLLWIDILPFLEKLFNWLIFI
jgi:hypothetical protein